MAVQVKDTGVYAIELNPKLAKFKDIAVYAIELAVPKVQMRQAVGAITVSSSVTDYTKTGTARLLAAVNQEYKMTLQADQVTFTTPAANSTRPGFNTTVIMNPVLGKIPYSGNMQFWYWRPRLADAFVGKDPATFTVTADTTVHALLPQLNSFFGLALEQIDVVNGSVTASAGKFILQAATTSLAFRTGVGVTIGHAPT